MLRKAPVGVVADAPGYGQTTLKRATPSVTVTGAPGELVLWMFGRQKVAEVTFAGDDVSVERLKQTHFGM